MKIKTYIHNCRWDDTPGKGILASDQVYKVTTADLESSSLEGRGVARQTRACYSHKPRRTLTRISNPFRSNGLPGLFWSAVPWAVIVRSSEKAFQSAVSLFRHMGLRVCNLRFRGFRANYSQGLERTRRAFASTDFRDASIILAPPRR